LYNEVLSAAQDGFTGFFKRYVSTSAQRAVELIAKDALKATQQFHTLPPVAESDLSIVWQQQL